jgi:N-succinyldiaminopimelate aminotransferase
MTKTATGLSMLSDGSLLSPFSRLRRLLEDVTPGHARAIDLTLGEPREAMPGFVGEALREAASSLAKYPAIRGSDALREAIATWLQWRFGPELAVDASREILPCNGSREGLFYACFPAVGRKRVSGRPAVLMCNPYYQAYMGAAYATGAEPVFLNATAATGHLPDLDALASDSELLERTAAFYLCSPANPQGAVASRAYLLRALELARRYDFMLFVDECYSEIYNDDAPVGALQVAATTPERFANIVVFNSLSKRSNLPGLRSGLAAGDGAFMDTLFEVRNLIGPQMPGPTQHASALAWGDEAHVATNREAYRRKFDVCDSVLGSRLGYRRPAGGFFLWLDMRHFGNGADATVTLWQRCGVKVIPGAYLGSPDRFGVNPGEHYVRVALVHDEATIREALERLVEVAA